MFELFYVFLYLMVALGVVAAITQIVLPLGHDTPMFPFLLKQRNALEQKLVSANQELQDSQLAVKVKETRKQVQQTYKDSK